MEGKKSTMKRKTGTSIDFLFGSGRAAEKTGKKYKKMKLVVD